MNSLRIRLSLTIMILGVLIACVPAIDGTASDDAERELKVGTLRVGKILFLGNSITRHGPAENIGWTGDWGMAASAREKDYVHQLLERISRAAGGKPRAMVRNIADFERNLSDFDVADKLKDELAFNADVIILAIGENVAPLKTDQDGTRFAEALSGLLAQLQARSHGALFVRSQFWPDEAKDRILKEACADAGGIFVDIGALGRDEANYARSEREIEHEGVAAHPGDKGMARIADELWKAIQIRGELEK